MQLKQRNNKSIDIQKKEYNLFIIILCMVVILLIPLYAVADYAHPSVDDYSYGKFASEVWEETGSVWKVLENAWERTAYTYETRQGTFSSIFFMRIQPAIFGEQYYFLTTVFLLTTFLVCSLFFYVSFFGTLFRASKVQSWLLALVLTIGALEFTHVVSDSFYWYNGGVTYTLFFSMEALLFGCLIQMYGAKKKWKKILFGMLSMFLAFFTCGGNYVTSLVTVEILVFVCFLVSLREYSRKHKQDKLKLPKVFTKIFTSFYYMTEAKEEKQEGKWNILFCFFTLCMAVLSFCIVVLAPGNAIRQEEVGGARNPIVAILLSFVYGAYSIGNCMNLSAWLLLGFCVPLFAVIARNSSFSFRSPLLVTFFSYCLYSSQATPMIYAQGIKIPYRIMNIIYFSCFVMMSVNVFYWIGYMTKQKANNVMLSKICTWHEVYFWRFYVIAFFIFCFSVAGGISIEAEVDVDGKAQVEIKELPATLSACYVLLNGEAKQFDKESWERYAIYSDDSIKEVEVTPFSVTPDIIFHSDITEDKNNWKNQCVKKYFDKKSVKLKSFP